MYRQTEEVADIRKTYQWMKKAGLKDSTEAQEQALNTRSIEAGGKMLEDKADMEHHNQVAEIIHRNI